MLHMCHASPFQWCHPWCDDFVVCMCRGIKCACDKVAQGEQAKHCGALEPSGGGAWSHQKECKAVHKG